MCAFNSALNLIDAIRPVAEFFGNVDLDNAIFNCSDKFRQLRQLYIQRNAIQLHSIAGLRQTFGEDYIPRLGAASNYQDGGHIADTIMQDINRQFPEIARNFAFRVSLMRRCGCNGGTPHLISRGRSTVYTSKQTFVPHFMHLFRGTVFPTIDFETFMRAESSATTRCEECGQVADDEERLQYDGAVESPYLAVHIERFHYENGAPRQLRFNFSGNYLNNVAMFGEQWRFEGAIELIWKGGPSVNHYVAWRRDGDSFWRLNDSNVGIWPLIEGLKDYRVLLFRKERIGNIQNFK